MHWGSVMTPISVLNQCVSRPDSLLAGCLQPRSGFVIGRVCGRRCRRRLLRRLSVGVRGGGACPRVRVWILGAGGGAGRDATASPGGGGDRDLVILVIARTDASPAFYSFLATLGCL